MLQSYFCDLMAFAEGRRWQKIVRTFRAIVLKKKTTSLTHGGLKTFLFV